ncbi:MAG: hypothetical protein AAGK78_15795, partial [Planctomycetota bacterium]
MIRTTEHTPSRDHALRKAATSIFEKLEPRRLLSGSSQDAGPGNENVGAAIVENHHPVRQDAPLTIFSWHDWELEGVTPMIWARSDYLTPQQAFNETIGDLRDTPEGERAVFLWQFGEHMLDNGLSDFLRTGEFNLGADAAWLDAYLT